MAYPHARTFREGLRRLAICFVALLLAAMAAGPALEFLAVGVGDVAAVWHDCVPKARCAE